MKFAKVGVLPTDEVLKSDSRSKLVVERLRAALLAGRSPRPMDPVSLTVFSVAFPDQLHAQLVQASKDRAVPFEALCAGLLAAPAEGAEETSGEGPGEYGFLRPLLRPLACGAESALDRAQIVLAEAATGSGKGRMVALLASRRRGTTVVAAPLSVTRQLLDDFRLAAPGIQPRFILGRANFINPVAALEWLEGNELPVLREWIECGGRPTSPDMRRLAEVIPGLAWLYEDALHVCGENAPVASWILEPGETCNAAEETYQRLRALDPRSNAPIFCSHMVVAADARMRTLDMPGGLLPDRIDTLFVDEAHQLESAFATVFSQTIHLHALAGKIRRTSYSSEVIQRMLAALDVLSGATLAAADGAASRRAQVGVLWDFAGVAAAMEKFRAAMPEPGAAPGRLRAEAKSARLALQHAARAFDTALSGFATIQVGASPVLRRPQLTVGRSNLDKPLKGLWDRCGSAALVSATLYTPDMHGRPHGKYTRWVLAIPQDRVAFLDPVAPKWITESVSLRRVFSEFTPDDSDEWLDSVARQAQEIHRQAAGGVLVLATSYATAEALGARLEALGDDLIFQSGGRPAAVCAAAFRRRSSEGKPLWIGVGSAWTGIDLSDKGRPAEEDRLLTDLFIPRIPAGCNRTLTHQRRREFMQSAELLETLRLFKQGIGRLVRREGVHHRKLWIGDRRLLQRNAFYRTLEAILKPYDRAS